MEEAEVIFVAIHTGSIQMGDDVYLFACAAHNLFMFKFPTSLKVFFFCKISSFGTRNTAHILSMLVWTFSDFTIFIEREAHHFKKPFITVHAYVYARFIPTEQVRLFHYKYWAECMTHHLTLANRKADKNKQTLVHCTHQKLLMC